MQVRIIIAGIIQGVGFRPFIYRIANENNLSGFVRNRADASVEILVQGEQKDINRFLHDIKERRPVLASYDDFRVEHVEEQQNFDGFSILPSDKSREITGSVIPPDISICNECVREVSDAKDRRYNYHFNTCTKCGPRFTVIEELPYDRSKTTMSDFELCAPCSAEYNDPLNRRFHAQTIACVDCGPQLFVTDNKGVKIDVNDPITLVARLLKEGYIVAIKGVGGFHIATSALDSRPIARLRKVKHRKSKPFAVMAKDLKSVRTFAVISNLEEELLTSYMKPIVLLRKREDYYLSSMISPFLHNIGVMLPYTSLHFLLFKHLDEPALVMTSANPSNEPIVKDDGEALMRIGGSVDYFLFHNRRIAMRCDDSVVRINLSPCVIRRARGYVPSPIYLQDISPVCILGLGAEYNVTFSLVVGNKAIISQHIGDIEKAETYIFLKESIKHFTKLVNADPQVIACDLHPSMHTTKLAYLMSQSQLPVVQVQHHHAHIASLMAEHGMQEIIGIACDGAGYGSDGKVWGGEIIFCDHHTHERVGHLMEQPMIGGDLATFYPLRMVAGALCNTVEGLEDYLYSKSTHFPNGRKEVELMIENMRGKVPIATTSTGRILDAVSALLDICYERTYEGEPAMRLESLAVNGDDLKINTVICNNILDTTFLLQYVYENKNRFSLKDLAYSAHSYIARGLAEIASNEANARGVKTVGFSGGVAYNEIVTRLIAQEIKRTGLRFLLHSKVPPGDSGISLGQACVAYKTAK
ncbi:MAG: carbamoyltransferase HypF [Nitrososphaerales archaeon]